MRTDKIFWGSACICNVVQCILAIMLLVYMGEVDKLTTVSLSSVTQVTSDWTVKPWTDVVVRKESQGYYGCASGEEILFSKKWGGTVKGCKWSNSNDINEAIITYTEYESRRNNNNNKNRRTTRSCDTIAAKSAITMTSVNDTYICGKRGGKSFADSVRPDPTTKRCPSGYFQCSNSTSAANTICTKNRNDCPVTFLRFMTDRDYNRTGSTYNNTRIFEK